MTRTRRLPSSLEPSPLARLRAGVTPRWDLTESNPTRCDLPYPADLMRPLADPRGLVYEPDPRGPRAAREAVAAELGSPADAGRIVLTASTSEAYAMLFKLLADPGQAIGLPQPSYPLLEHLTRLEGVETAPYLLDADAAWQLDRASVAALPRATRAIVVVHPNNPTGSYTHPDDVDWLGRRCRERGWALIADEVFLPFPIGFTPGWSESFTTHEGCLTFTLGGLSKSLGLPQLKLAWIAVSGPEAELDAALDELDYIADSYLSVSHPVAYAVAELFHAAAPVRQAIRSRIAANFARLRDDAVRVPASSVDVPGGGWSAVLRIPSVLDEEELVTELLTRDGVAVQPGFLYDFAEPGRLVLSLLPPEPVFREGLVRLLDRLAAKVSSL